MTTLREYKELVQERDEIQIRWQLVTKLSEFLDELISMDRIDYLVSGTDISPESREAAFYRLARQDCRLAKQHLLVQVEANQARLWNCFSQLSGPDKITAVEDYL